MTRSATTSLIRLAVFLATFWVGAAGAQPEAPDSLESLRNARDVLLDVEDFSAALDPATRIVEQVRNTDDPERGADLLRLAEVQAGMKEFGEAETDFLDAIDTLIDTGGESDPALVDAYHGLGRTYLDTRRFDEALIAFDEARTVSRRNEGLFNVDQSAIIDDMTLAYLGSGNTWDAKALQQERLDNAIRRFGADDARVIPFHTHFGDYLDSSRLRVGARDQYEQALELSEQQFGEGHPASLPLLRRLSEIDLLLDRDSDVYQQIDAVLSSDARIDPVERARSLLAIADRDLVYAGIEAAAPRYRQAWDLLDAHEAVDAKFVFSTPLPLNLIPPLSAVDLATRRRPWTWGTLTLSFDVAADGRASNVSVVAMEPRNDRVASDYSRRIRETLFRPRLVDGEPVGTADVHYDQSFRYYVRKRDRGE